MYIAVYMRAKARAALLRILTPSVVIVDDRYIVTKNGKDFRNNLKFVNDLRKVVNLMDYQDSQTTGSSITDRR